MTERRGSVDVDRRPFPRDAGHFRGDDPAFRVRRRDGARPSGAIRGAELSETLERSERSEAVGPP